MKQINILIVYPLSLGIPGGGTIGCIEISRHLKDLGAVVTIISVKSDGARGSFGRRNLPSEHGADAVEQLNAYGIPVISVGPSKVHYSLDGLPVRKALKSVLEQQKPNLVIGWHHELLWSFDMLHKKEIDTGLITAAPSYSEFQGRSALARWVRKIVIHTCLRKAGVIFCPSEYIRQNILQTGTVSSTKIKVNPWGVNRKFFDSRPRPSLESIRLIFYGWWIQEKGIYDLLQSLAPLSNPNWELEVTGWGDARRVQEAAEVNGIGHRLKIFGRLSHQELIAKLEHANLAILPSYVESFGLAVTEAQASGVPVVAYACGAVPEIIEDGKTGWLVKTGDIAGLTHAIQAAMQDPTDALIRGQIGRQRALENFTWEKTASRIMAEIR